jgi:hypothetical protein
LRETVDQGRISYQIVNSLLEGAGESGHD